MQYFFELLVFHRPHNCPNLRRCGIMVIQQKRSEVGYSHSNYATICSGNMEGECGSVQSGKLLGEDSYSLSSLRSCSGPNCSKGYHGQQALNSERNATYSLLIYISHGDKLQCNVPQSSTAENGYTKSPG